MVHARVRKERKRRAKSFSLQSMGFRWTGFRWSEFVGPRTKFHRISIRATRGVPKTRDFFEDPSEEFRKSKVSGLGSVLEDS